MKAFRKVVRIWHLDRFGDDEVKSIKILRAGMSSFFSESLRTKFIESSYVVG